MTRVLVSIYALTTVSCGAAAVNGPIILPDLPPEPKDVSVSPGLPKSAKCSPPRGTIQYTSTRVSGSCGSSASLVIAMKPGDNYYPLLYGGRICHNEVHVSKDMCDISFNVACPFSYEEDNATKMGAIIHIGQWHWNTHKGGDKELLMVGHHDLVHVDADLNVICTSEYAETYTQMAAPGGEGG